MKTKSMQSGVCALLSVSMLFGAGAAAAQVSNDEAPALKVARRLAAPPATGPVPLAAVPAAAAP
ncbi:MAG: hypothetical protein U1B84_24825, partial [Variovorax sp.]|nr:hypothetical protein [Variovorax sp.]